MKKISIISGLLLSAASIFAQTYESDAAHMMRPDLNGTARSLGAGGAFSTVGADQSAVVQNPAGIALYRTHEFSLSAGAVFGTTNTNYLGQQSSSSFSKGTFSQAGFVFASRDLHRTQKMSFNNQSKLSRVVFGIGYQKLADFSRTDKIYAVNNQNSYGQAFATSLNTNPNNINLDYFDIPTVQAYQTYVTRDIDSNGHQGATLGGPVTQIGTVTTKGSLSDINMTLGFNVDDIVYLGFGLGVPYMSYTRNASFSESNRGGDSSYTMNYNYSLSGVGVNGKFGVIVKPVQWMRFGASVQTPSYFHLMENTEGNAFSQLGASAYSADTSSIYHFTYNNPLNATFGASFYLKQWGFLSVDYEMNDYSHTHYNFSDASSYASQINTLIAAKYKLASTVKVGAEFAWKTLRLRGGFAWSESPFRNGVAVNGYDGARFNYTAGIGYRGKRFFADLAYVRTQYKDYYSPYSYTDATGTQEPGAYNNFHNNMIVATVGVKFGLNR